MRKALIATAALVAAVIFFLLVTLPPAPTVASGLPKPELARRTVGGAYHVHTTRSDGSASRDAVAAAAARAGLQFVIFTDHGDGTEPPAPPAYLHGVLCIDGVEISTNGGHYVALDMARAPYPLGGEADTVVEDVRRLGGFGIAAHPDSARAPLRWTDWSLGFDGLEWLNADAEWRDEPARRLIRVPFDYVFRPAGALASMLDRPDAVLARWDGIAGQRAIAGLAAHDAHGGVATRLEGSQFGRLGMPSYEASFRAFEMRVVVGQPLESNAEADARRLLEAVRAGRVFTAITALASPAWLEFGATQGERVAAMGDTLSPDLPATLSVRRPHLAGALTVLVCNGNELERSSATDVAWSVAAPGACRVEVRIADAPGAPPIPWIVSNPIYLHPPALEPAAASGVESVIEMTVPVDSRSLVVEKDAASRATLTATEAGVALDYQLGAGTRASQYVALAAPIRAPVQPFDQIVVSSRSSRPMRLSVQLRFDDSGGARWGASVFVPSKPVRLSVPVSRLRAYQPGESRPDWTKLTGLLLVVDLTNAHPGFEGRLEVSDLALGRHSNTLR